MAACALANLFAATEAIGDDQGVGRCLADGGKQFQFTDCQGNVVSVMIETERSGHAAYYSGRPVENNSQFA